jgi:hypothetical protein
MSIYIGSVFAARRKILSVGFAPIGIIARRKVKDGISQNFLFE